MISACHKAHAPVLTDANGLDTAERLWPLPGFGAAEMAWGLFYGRCALIKALSCQMKEQQGEMRDCTTSGRLKRILAGSLQKSCRGKSLSHARKGKSSSSW